MFKISKAIEVSRGVRTGVRTIVLSTRRLKGSSWMVLVVFEEFSAYLSRGTE